MSTAINMFYKQIILNNGLPFKVVLSAFESIIPKISFSSFAFIFQINFKIDAENCLKSSKCFVIISYTILQSIFSY